MNSPAITLPHQSKTMNWKIITWYIGISLLLIAALMSVSGIIALCTDGDESGIPLLYSAFLTGTVGFYPLIFVRKGRHRLSFREGNCIVVGAWLVACLFGMLPFLFYGREFTPINALFESVSGFTTTGASILDDIEALPRGLQFHDDDRSGQIGPFQSRNLRYCQGCTRGRKRRQLCQSGTPDICCPDSHDRSVAESHRDGLV